MVVLPLSFHSHLQCVSRLATLRAVNAAPALLLPLPLSVMLTVAYHPLAPVCGSSAHDPAPGAHARVCVHGAQACLRL